MFGLLRRMRGIHRLTAGTKDGVTRRSVFGAAAIGVLPLSQEGCAAAVEDTSGVFRQVGRGAVSRKTSEKLRERVSVLDFGALGDGKTDDTDAIQAAFDSGAAKVLFPKGRYVTGPLRVPDWLHIEGEGYQPSIGGDGRSVELRFKLTSGTALSCGASPIIRNIFFQNAGGSYDEENKTLSGTSASAIQLEENAVIEECCFSLWKECVRTGPSTFYLKTSRLHFNRCIVGYQAAKTSPYNIHIDAPHSVLTEVFLAGEGNNVPRNVKVYGGSIEGYSSVSKHFQDIAFFGTYFETDAPRRKVVAIEPSVNGCSVALFGCMIYMNRTARFVSMSGSRDAMLTSIGNVFDGVGEPGGICLQLPQDGTVTLAGDRFGTAHPPTCLYVDSMAAAAKHNIGMPYLPDQNVQRPFSTAQIIGPRGLVMAPLIEEPSHRPSGMMVCADGRKWNPLSRAGGRPYWTVWQGDRWSPISG
jgi:hypothetical protein